MKKKKLAFLAFVIIAIALLLEAGILKSVNNNNTYQMSKVLLDRVVTVLNKNDENGYIYSGSMPKYYGYNFDSGEQMSYF